MNPVGADHQAPKGRPLCGRGVGPPSCPTRHRTRNPALPQPPYPAGDPRAGCDHRPQEPQPRRHPPFRKFHPAVKRESPRASREQSKAGTAPSLRVLPAHTSCPSGLGERRRRRLSARAPAPPPTPSPALSRSVRPRGGLCEPNIHTGAGQQPSLPGTGGPRKNGVVVGPAWGPESPCEYPGAWRPSRTSVGKGSSQASQQGWGRNPGHTS